MFDHPSIRSRPIICVFLCGFLVILLMGCKSAPVQPRQSVTPSLSPSAIAMLPASTPSPTRTWISPTVPPIPSATNIPQPGKTSTATSRREDGLRITIVYDNHLYDERLSSEWGFAALVEAHGHVLLFDTGGSATLMANMHLLGIDPRRIEAVVLSHEHMDHIGGLFPFLAEADQPTVFLLSSFPAAFKLRVAALTDVIQVSGPVEIFPDIYTTGEVTGNGIAEQALAIRTEMGSVVLTGCAHPGIVQMVRRGRSALQPGEGIDYDAVTLVVGGFHLASKNASQVEAIIAELQSLDVERVCPTHCTGNAAIAMFAEAYGEGYIPGGAGMVITVP